MKSKCFGSEAAITVELSISCSRSNYKTIIFDFAEIMPAQTSQTKNAGHIQSNCYNWDNKCQFQLTEKELFYFALFCIRSEEKLIFGGHDNNRKQLVVVRKKSGFMYILNWKETSINCFMPHHIVFQTFNIAIIAMSQNQPGIPTSQIIESLKSIHVL